MVRILSPVKLGLLLLGAALLSATPASAASFKFVADQTVYSVAPGANVPVTIYLLEEDGPYIGTTGPSGQNGLFGFSVAVSQDVVSNNITGASIDSNFQSSSAFPSFPVSTITLAGDRNNPSFSAFAGPMPDAQGLIRLGTLSITAPASGSRTFTLFDNGDAADNTVTYAFNSLDNLIDDSNPSFTITVPEPASASLLLMALPALLRRRRRSSREM